MKQRLLTAAIGLALFAVIMLFFETLIYNAAIAVLCFLAVYELLVSTKYVQSRPLLAAGLAFALAAPFLRMQAIRPYSILFLALFVGMLFFILLRCHDTVRMEQIGLVFFISVFFPFALTSLIYIRDQFGGFLGFYYTLLIFACAWGADAGAYFIGRLFGKRKLAPAISPNKTVEGLIGGMAACLLIMALVTWAYGGYADYLGIAFHPRWLVMLLTGLVGSLLSVFGDLSASIIKRQSAIKDFGSIMPGHGGVVDRFDSIFFVAPFFYLVLQFIQF